MTQNNPAAITLLGLGPGGIQDMTREALTQLEQAASDNFPVYFRTIIHPTVEPLKTALPALRINRLTDSMMSQKTGIHSTSRSPQRSVVWRRNDRSSTRYRDILLLVKLLCN